MNAIKNVFPECLNVLCMWHINKNVLANCKKLFKDEKGWTEFQQSWNQVVYSKSEFEFEEALQQFQAFSGPAILKPPTIDILDQTIRSARTLERVIEQGSVHSKQWNIATSIVVEDFAAVLRSSDD